MRRIAVTALLLSSLSASACQPAPTPPPPTPPAAAPSRGAINVSRPDIAYVSIGDQSSRIFFLDKGKSAAFATSDPTTTDPAVSPDGKRIAYVAVKPGEKFRLVVSGLDGGNAKTLFETMDTVFTPAWSPDGKTLAFIRKGSDQFELCTIPATGGEPTSIAAKSDQGPLENMLAPCWTKDGKSLLVTAQGGENLLVFKVAPETGAAKPVGPGFAAQLAPDGQAVVYVDIVDKQPQLKIARPNLATPRRIEATMPMGARWSYDGRHLFFNQLNNGQFELWMADPNGDHASKVAEAGNAILSSSAILLPSILSAMQKQQSPAAMPTIRHQE